MGKRILITGAAGNIGSKLVRGLRERYELVLVDRRKGPGTRVVDLSRWDHSIREILNGVETVIHLAGNPDEKAQWKDLVNDNIHALLNVWHGAVMAGVRSFVFASSCHTMGGYWNEENPSLITTDMAPRPDSDYGASKVVGEEICRNFSLRHGISSICLRIGWVPRDGRAPGRGASMWLRSLWLGEKDLLGIMTCAIEAEDVGFGIFYAVSGNCPGLWDLSGAERMLGFRPVQGSDPECFLIN
jgi:nucleoside-diphosphate-sugar epimerase